MSDDTPMPRSEAELCDAFAEAARLDGWSVYPEVGGFDLVLVWTGARASRYDLDSMRVAVGYQVGIDAKLRANADVLAQAAGRMDHARRPDVAGVLVPEYSEAFRYVARRLGLRLFSLEHCRPGEKRYGYARPRETIDPGSVPAPLPYGRAREPLELPPVPLQGSGGAASPRVLSGWRVAALRTCIALDAKGSLTRAEGRVLGVDLAHWQDRGWVSTDGKRPATYTPGPKLLVWGGPVAGYEAERDALRVADARAPGEPPGIAPASAAGDVGRHPGERPRCQEEGCSSPATCLGAYGGASAPSYACDACCGHAGEDGRCEPITGEIRPGE